MHTRALMIAFVASLASCTPDGGPAETQAAQRSQTTPREGDALEIIDSQIGDGEVATAGRRVEVHYTGWLYEDGERGNQFDSSRDRGEPFVFSLGAGQVIRGWDEGVQGMRTGGHRELIIPPAMGYGERGFPPVIPPNSTLNFEIELLRVLP